MKSRLKILSAFTIAAISASSYALSECPSINKIRNAVFTMAYPFGSEWIVLSNPIDNEDQSEWGVLIDMQNPSIQTSEQAIAYANNKIKVVSLTQPEPKARGNTLECWYTDSIDFQVVAGNPFPAISSKIFK